MRPQGFRGLWCEAYGSAALPGLRFAERNFPAAPGERAPHAHDGVFHVHILPPEREQFSLPHADLANRRGAETCVQPVAVETLDVGRVELLELRSSEDRLDVIVNEVRVSIVGALTHGAVRRSLEPYVK